MLSPGVVLNGRYQLTQRIAAGGMGEVWRGNDLLLHREIAVKVLLPALMSDADFITRFRSEARMMAALRHPGIVQVYDYGENAAVGAHRLDYLVMEYIDGTPLSKRIQQAGRLGPAETMTIVAQVAEALQTAHEGGIIHRDVKPSNLLVRPAGAIVLVDFGVARSAGITGITSTNVVLGSAHYMAPEQAEGRPVTAATDMYALGAVAFCCLTGRPPYVGDNPLAVLAQLVHGTPPVLPPDVPPATASVVMRALARDPARRFPDAAGLAAAARAASHPAGYAVSAPISPNPAPPGAASAPSSGAAAAPLFGAAPIPPGSSAGMPGGTPGMPGGTPGMPGSSPGMPGGSAVSGAVSLGSLRHETGTNAGATGAHPAKSRRLTVALAAVAVGLMLAGGGIVLGNQWRSGEPEKVSEFDAGGQPPAGDGESPRARDQVTDRPIEQRKPSANGDQPAKPTTPVNESSPAVSAPAGDPTATASTDPAASTSPTPTTTTETNPYKPVDICGNGYSVIDKQPLTTAAGVKRGVVYLLYAADGSNCVVTVKSNTLDQKTAMSATLEVKGGAQHLDKGSFQYYAGPVHAAADGICVRWGGTIGGLTYQSPFEHCG
ncbi:hypothetical protein Aca07nite_58410 [Actinoplanes capillaceus]|uniref:non-specific serine/threonine protein kinase n=1 Tax=Actinoplanes campanulatus TaxID=113559 RepID=A0ABQ3WQU9_9ACTN|nr:serine/threonine-protein kinase [Actinoplanes capillaceus]GID48566.1 hypothetical protein Aca07nite_58410 [Actinoplanes capillaceus]